MSLLYQSGWVSSPSDQLFRPCFWPLKTFICKCSPFRGDIELQNDGVIFLVSTFWAKFVKILAFKHIKIASGVNFFLRYHGFTEQRCPNVQKNHFRDKDDWKIYLKRSKLLLKELEIIHLHCYIYRHNQVLIRKMQVMLNQVLLRKRDGLI